MEDCVYVCVCPFLCGTLLFQIRKNNLTKHTASGALASCLEAGGPELCLRSIQSSLPSLPSAPCAWSRLDAQGGTLSSEQMAQSHSTIAGRTTSSFLDMTLSGQERAQCPLVPAGGPGTPYPGLTVCSVSDASGIQKFLV